MITTDNILDSLKDGPETVANLLLKIPDNEFANFWESCLHHKEIKIFLTAMHNYNQGTYYYKQLTAKLKRVYYPESEERPDE